VRGALAVGNFYLNFDLTRRNKTEKDTIGRTEAFAKWLKMLIFRPKKEQGTRL